MTKDNTIIKEKLFDGDESGLGKITFDIPSLTFKVSDFLDNPLRNLLKDNSNTDDFDTIIKSENFQKKGALIQNFYTEQNLQVYYLIVQNRLYLFSFGEFQPMRFILYLESVWNL
ncbi:hypothetical protein [Pedobacter rhodius]|uniref:Uncharacterized protein n=1 Tax=Pedobacter rhodius TaxID=3004098 RepID=A0ABT4L0K7_9SPHI|nr:hypothetical protein [Pedobacter sp. SJ11]MCZ4223982.1 hypothetical protein [Pedobacter sp. SJ11]